MPHTIHTDATRKQMYLNVMRPQEAVPTTLPENWSGTSSQGLPVREIPFWEFPKVLYLHPNRPFIEREGPELTPAEHLSMVVGCEAHKSGAPGGPKDCADCNKLLAEALDAGWVEKPYIPATPAKPNDLYGPRKKK